MPPALALVRDAKRTRGLETDHEICRLNPGHRGRTFRPKRIRFEHPDAVGIAAVVSGGLLTIFAKDHPKEDPT